MQCRSLDDLERPAAGSRGSGSHFRALIAAVGEDALDEGKQATRSSVEHQRSAVAILDIGGMNGDAQQEAERIDEDVPLAALDLLARVVALRIERSPPFCAPLALWLSMIAAVGLASRPACSRTAT